MEQVCRTNLFKFEFVAVKKIHVLMALNNSIFGALLCVILIYHKEALVKFLTQLENIFRSNLFEFHFCHFCQFVIFQKLAKQLLVKFYILNSWNFLNKYVIFGNFVSHYFDMLSNYKWSINFCQFSGIDLNWNFCLFKIWIMWSNLTRCHDATVKNHYCYS